MHCTTSSESYSSSMKDSPSKWPAKNEKGYMYKKSAYQYSTSGNSFVDTSQDKNIDQLDALLEDLKNERKTTRERDMSSSVGYRTIERERAEPAGTVTKTTRIIKTSQHSAGTKPLDDIENISTSDYSTVRSNGYSTMPESRNKSYVINKPIAGNTYENKLYESNRLVENIQQRPSTSATNVTHLEKDIQNIALSEDILPLPGTKVTTTVRTYTYEVPAGPSANISLDNKSEVHDALVYSTINRNEVNQTLSNPRPNIPQTVVYNTESYSTLDKNNILPTQTFGIREHRENRIGIDNFSSQPHLPNTGTTKTIVYNINSTENIETVPKPNQYPSHKTPAHSPQGVLPVYLPNPTPTSNRFFYKESSNLTNTIHGPVPQQEKNIPMSKKPLRTGQLPYDDDYPSPVGPGTSAVTYKYSSSTTNTQNRQGPYYGTTSPFPVEGVDVPIENGNPPQRVDDLMQSFGNTDVMDRSAGETSHRKREIETSVATSNQQIIPSVNRAGKEVYYPPGHDTIVTKREEMVAGSAAGGRWAKGSGNYEYESGYKSKSKTKSGGAVVPVCLPLCCAMPCSIM